MKLFIISFLSVFNILFSAESRLCTVGAIERLAPSHIRASMPITDTNNDDALEFIDFKKNCLFGYSAPGAYGNHQIILADCINPHYGWVHIAFFPRLPNVMREVDSLAKRYQHKLSAQWQRNYLTTNDKLIYFEVWAVFVDKKDDKELLNADGHKVYAPNYPCRVRIYMLSRNNKWVFTNQITAFKPSALYSAIPAHTYGPQFSTP